MWIVSDWHQLLFDCQVDVFKHLLCALYCILKCEVLKIHSDGLHLVLPWFSEILTNYLVFKKVCLKLDTIRVLLQLVLKALFGFHLIITLVSPKEILLFYQVKSTCNLLVCYVFMYWCNNCLPGLSGHQHPSHNTPGLVQWEVFGSLCCRSVIRIMIIMIRINVQKQVIFDKSNYTRITHLTKLDPAHYCSSPSLKYQDWLNGTAFQFIWFLPYLASSLFLLFFSYQESGLWLQTMFWTVLVMAPGLERDPMKWPFPQVPHPPSTLSDSGERRWQVED